MVKKDNFQDAVDAYFNKDYKTAYELWLPLAKRGHVYAQSNLGVMYQKGQGVAQDDQEAVKWFRLSAEQGDALAQLSCFTSESCFDIVSKP